MFFVQLCNLTHKVKFFALNAPYRKALVVKQHFSYIYFLLINWTFTDLPVLFYIIYNMIEYKWIRKVV